MAQQTSQYPPPPRSFSPPQRTDSPQYGGPLQNKRQRMSPPAQSPYSSPSLSNISLPNQVFSSPYYGAQTNGTPPNQMYAAHSGIPPNLGHNNIPTPPQPSPAGPSPGSPAVMGPPSKPNDNKPTDLNELGDVLFGAGIDLREEDAALLRSNNANASTSSVQEQLYEAGYQSAPKATYPFPQYNNYSHNVPGGRNTFYGGGTFNQPAGPIQSVEEIAEISRKRALRRKAEISSYHLNAPFLSAAGLRCRLRQGLARSQVKVDDTGLYHTQEPNPPPRQFAVSGPDRNEIIKVVRGQDLLRHDSSHAELLTLLSTAAEERIRMLVEDAATLAKGRRTGSHGVVPQDLAGLVEGEFQNGSITDAVLSKPDSETSSKENPLKRSYAESNVSLVSIPNSVQPSKAPVNPVIEAFHKIAVDERAREEVRLAKRKRREAAASGSPLTPNSAGLSTPGLLGEQAPDVEPKKSVLKKDLKKASELSNPQAIAASNKTMNMALGISGAMGKKLSWMTNKADTGPSNPYIKRPAPSAGASKISGINGNGITSSLPPNRIYGKFREDRETGAGIQLRDVISALEHDGKEKKALQLAYGKLGIAAGVQRR